MQSIAFFHLVRGGSRSFSFIITKPTFSCFSSASCKREDPNLKSFFINYLITTFNFSESKATYISNTVVRKKSPEKPFQNLNFLRECGFSETHIQKLINGCPSILALSVDSILKPKIKVLLELGVTAPELAHFVSKNSSLLSVSLDKKLVPCIKALKKFFSDDKDVIRVLSRCRLIFRKSPNDEFLPNLKLLENAGIVGSQLSSLLKSRPHLFVMTESRLKHLVNRVTEMGFSSESGMFVHALRTVSSTKADTLARKIKLFESFGFSKNEIQILFQKFPVLFNYSEKKLKIGLKLFLKTIKVNPSVILSNPMLLMFSVEKRILPRYNVLSVLKSKSLLKKDQGFILAMMIPEATFLKKYILKFEAQVEELMATYRGNISV